ARGGGGWRLPSRCRRPPWYVARLGAVFCARVPFFSTRYAAVTWSLWSMSTTLKSRVVGHTLPSRAVPSAGTASLPALTAAFAAVKNAGALQYANWPNIEVLSPLTHLPAATLPRLDFSVSVSPL